MDTNKHEWGNPGRALVYLSSCLLAACCSVRAEFVISTDGKAACVIVQQNGATEAEKSAVRELTKTLHLITGAEFTVSAAASKPSQAAIVVGPGTVAAEYFPEVDLTKLAGEECVMRSKAGKLLLAGGGAGGAGIR